jgi:hypothetical protein
MRSLATIVSNINRVLDAETNNVVAIGNLLIEAREQLEHGQWTPWLKENFRMSADTAANYMDAAGFASKFRNFRNLPNLSASTLYILAHHADEPDWQEPIRLILKEARSKRIYPSDVSFIVGSYRLEQRQEERSEVAQTAEEILDGPPPELPSSGAGRGTEVRFEVNGGTSDLADFDAAVATLLRLRGKRLRTFVATRHADQLLELAKFLKEVAGHVRGEGSTLIEAAE